MQTFRISIRDGVYGRLLRRPPSPVSAHAWGVRVAAVQAFRLAQVRADQRRLFSQRSKSGDAQLPFYRTIRKVAAQAELLLLKRRPSGSV